MALTSKIRQGNPCTYTFGEVIGTARALVKATRAEAVTLVFADFGYTLMATAPAGDAWRVDFYAELDTPAALVGRGCMLTRAEVFEARKAWKNRKRAAAVDLEERREDWQEKCARRRKAPREPKRRNMLWGAHVSTFDHGKSAKLGEWRTPDLEDMSGALEAWEVFKSPIGDTGAAFAAETRVLGERATGPLCLDWDAAPAFDASEGVALAFLTRDSRAGMVALWHAVKDPNGLEG